MKPSKSQIHSALDLTRVVAEAVRQAGPDGIPSGTIYAQLMQYVTIDTYNSLIRMLERAELVKNDNHRLTWVGPQWEEGT